MANIDSIYISEWFEAADKDWHRVEILLENEDEEGAAFHLQQALEKFLKGYLLASGWEWQKIHVLEEAEKMRRLLNTKNPQ